MLTLKTSLCAYYENCFPLSLSSSVCIFVNKSKGLSAICEVLNIVQKEEGFVQLLCNCQNMSKNKRDTNCKPTAISQRWTFSHVTKDTEKTFKAFCQMTFCQKAEELSTFTFSVLVWLSLATKIVV